jgi:predicted acyltransferase
MSLLLFWRLKNHKFFNGGPGMKRVLALDALRGFAILTMILSGVIAYKILPAWMYHAQLPPPEHHFNPNLPGLTWVDLVFPLFLFAMGAAFPLAMNRRLIQGDSYFELIKKIVERTLLLAFFAVFIKHVHAYNIAAPNSPNTWHWFIALLAFSVMFAIYVRPKKEWNPKIAAIFKYSAWLIALLWLFFFENGKGEGFSFNRNDIIIIVLTNMAFFGALLWLFTREKLLLRLGILAIYLALRLSHGENPLFDTVWNWSPFPWLYRLDFLKYLFIVIPGSIAGDLIWSYSAAKEQNGNGASWPNTRLWTQAIFMLAIILFALIGYQSRWVNLTPVVLIIAAFVGLWLTQKPADELEKLVHKLWQWGAFWLILGVFFEPFEGGIKKDSSTMAYYFITSGLAVAMLISFIILLDKLRLEKAFTLLIHNGQNPMIAYIGVANVIWPILAMTGLEALLVSVTQTPFLGFLRGVLKTVLLAYMVSYFTKKKLFWKT